MEYRLLGVDATAVVLCDARHLAVVEHKFRGMAMLVRRNVLVFRRWRLNGCAAVRTHLKSSGNGQSHASDEDDHRQK